MTRVWVHEGQGFCEKDLGMGTIIAWVPLSEVEPIEKVKADFKEYARKGFPQYSDAQYDKFFEEAWDEMQTQPPYDFASAKVPMIKLDNGNVVYGLPTRQIRFDIVPEKEGDELG